MQAQETECNVKPHGRGFTRVVDNRKHRIRGLWKRGDKFYARLAIEDDLGKKTVRRIPLEAETVAQAQAEMRTLLVERRENRLRHIGQAPKLADYVNEVYLPRITGEKKPRTVLKEKGSLARWVNALGHLRLNKLRAHHVTAFRDKLKDEGLSNRTRNLYLVALRNVLKSALTDGHLKTLPVEGIDWLKTETRIRALVSPDELTRLCTAALKVSKNGQEVSDYIKLMAYCGARRDEALSLRWDAIDWERKQLIIGETKNRKDRRVDFNVDLEVHLKDMHSRRAPDSSWLFPSPQRGDKDIHAMSFRETLDLARKEANLPHFCFHDCRHYFVSHCVMSGADYMTVASWVGHQDGGILIGKVYGHLAAEHVKAQAQRIVFGPVIVKEPTHEAQQA